MIAPLRRRLVCLAAAGLLAAVPAFRTEAATCPEEVQLLADQYGLSGARQTAEARSGLATESPTGAAARPRAAPSTPLSAEQRARMEVLLNAARAAEEQNKTAECFARLGEARATPKPG